MSSSDFLRKNINQHSIKNSISKKMDSDIDIAVKQLILLLKKKYPHIIFEHKKKLLLSDIIIFLSRQFPKYSEHFSPVINSSFITPDGGFLFAHKEGQASHIILVAEVKRQGTNDKRFSEGLLKQARGNAIERLGKNLIGIRAIFKKENIIPFICFGSGDDFREGVTILDRVVTMNDFFALNTYFVKKEHLPFEPVSMFFRYEDWQVEDMVKKMLYIAEIAIENYFG